MYLLEYFKITLAVCWVQKAMCMDLGYSSDGDLSQLINAKAYLPDDKDLTKASIVKTGGDDATFILSKLSDNELIKLLKENPQRDEYNIDDVIKVSKGSDNKLKKEVVVDTEIQKEPDSAIFRLENRDVDPFAANTEDDPKYNALQKLNNILYSRPREEISAENDDKKEKIFDLLVSQLKSLCCKKNRLKKFRSINDPKIEQHSIQSKTQIQKQSEYIFLVLNDEISSNVSDSSELVPVDPNSLSENSKVLLLGPIINPLNDEQTKLVINRISKELSKPEYLSLLKNISDGLAIKNPDILKSLISGPNTRRYIKPHRCNHQSKLARIYYGPKWLICTGYLNLNTPSRYD